MSSTVTVTKSVNAYDDTLYGLAADTILRKALTGDAAALALATGGPQFVREFNDVETTTVSGTQTLIDLTAAGVTFPKNHVREITVELYSTIATLQGRTFFSCLIDGDDGVTPVALTAAGIQTTDEMTGASLVAFSVDGSKHVIIGASGVASDTTYMVARIFIGSPVPLVKA